MNTRLCDAAMRLADALSDEGRNEDGQIIIDLLDDLDAMDSKLDKALNAIVRRITADRLTNSMGEWLRLNYPKRYDMMMSKSFRERKA